MSVVRDCYSRGGVCIVTDCYSGGGVCIVTDCSSGGGQCQRLKCSPMLRHCVALGKVETGDDCVVPKARSSSILLSCTKNPWGHLDRVVDGVGGHSSGGGGEGPW